jgi:hypothetical protein
MGRMSFWILKPENASLVALPEYWLIMLQSEASYTPWKTALAQQTTIPAELHFQKFHLVTQNTATVR